MGSVPGPAPGSVLGPVSSASGPSFAPGIEAPRPPSAAVACSWLRPAPPSSRDEGTGDSTTGCDESSVERGLPVPSMPCATGASSSRAAGHIAPPAIATATIAPTERPTRIARPRLGRSHIALVRARAMSPPHVTRTANIRAFPRTERSWIDMGPRGGALASGSLWSGLAGIHGGGFYHPLPGHTGISPTFEASNGLAGNPAVSAVFRWEEGVSPAVSRCGR